MTQSLDALARGRDAVEHRRWVEACALLQEADAETPLSGEDLERLSVAAHLVGREEDAIAALERAHQAFLAAGDEQRAIRMAFWLTQSLMERGEAARAGGWAARAHRIVEACPEDCAARGDVALLDGLAAMGGGDALTARDRFAEAAAAGERHGDADLETLARHSLGRVLLYVGRLPEGFALLDELMIALTADELSPVVVGVVHCSVLEACRDVFDVRRAQEWTVALNRWCDTQPDVVPYRGQCLAYRSEVMRLHGAWPDAIEEARRAYEILSRPPPHPSVGMTLYHRAEVHRLRGEFALAEAAYREASRWGRPPEPGLALLRLMQGRVSAAEAAIRRVLDESQGVTTRSRLLPAFVEIVLAAGDVDAARTAVDELTSAADALDAPLLRAQAAHAHGQVLLAEGQPAGALRELRRAWSEWQTLEVPYEAARVRALIARACRALDDADGAALELDAARWAFEQLGAVADLAAADALLDRPGPPRAAGGLTAREVEVLRLVAAGKTNRDIAAELVISEKTVARHVSNILGRLDLRSRAAATAYAYEHGLL